MRIKKAAPLNEDAACRIPSSEHLRSDISHIFYMPDHSTDKLSISRFSLVRVNGIAEHMVLEIDITLHPCLLYRIPYRLFNSFCGSIVELSYRLIGFIQALSLIKKLN